jgi:hypothetical protein
VSNITIDYRSCQQADAAVRHWQATKPTPKPIFNKNRQHRAHASQIPPKPRIPALPATTIERT